MPITDPAWFYSSLAQVSAAIVGLAGAVLGTRLVSHIAEMQDLRSQIQPKISGIKSMMDGRSTRYVSKDLPAFVPAAPDVWRIAADGYVLLRGALTGDDLRSRAGWLRQAATAVPGNSGGEQQARNQLLHDANGLEQFADEVANFRSRLVPRPFVAILAVLTIITLTGIVWPLAALPSLPFPFSKTWMLGALTLALVILIGYFVYEFRVLASWASLSWDEENT